MVNTYHKDDIMCSCGEDTVYGSGKLTNNLCLNCYHRLQEDIKEADMHSRHDYEEGLL